MPDESPKGPRCAGGARSAAPGRDRVTPETDVPRGRASILDEVRGFELIGPRLKQTSPDRWPGRSRPSGSLPFGRDVVRELIPFRPRRVRCGLHLRVIRRPRPPRLNLPALAARRARASRTSTRERSPSYRGTAALAGNLTLLVLRHRRKPTATFEFRSRSPSRLFRSCVRRPGRAPWARRPYHRTSTADEPGHAGGGYKRCASIDKVAGITRFQPLGPAAPRPHVKSTYAARLGSIQLGRTDLLTILIKRIHGFRARDSF